MSGFVPEKLWQLILLTVILPPIGTLVIWRSADSPRWLKYASAVYCAALLLFLLLYRPSAGEVIIDAQPLR